MYNNILFISMPGPGEWILILLVVLVLFGGKRIPQLAKDLGSGIKEFRKSLSSSSTDSEIEEKKSETYTEPKKSPRKKITKKS